VHGVPVDDDRPGIGATREVRGGSFRVTDTVVERDDHLHPCRWPRGRRRDRRSEQPHHAHRCEQHPATHTPLPAQLARLTRSSRPS
jgi:hypothetical protein